MRGGPPDLTEHRDLLNAARNQQLVPVAQLRVDPRASAGQDARQVDHEPAGGLCRRDALQQPLGFLKTRAGVALLQLLGSGVLLQLLRVFL